MFVVVGAAGLALAVDKFVVGGGLTTPSSANAGQQASSASLVVRPDERAQVKAVEAPRTSASKLSAWRKAGEQLAPNAPNDAMTYPGWAKSGEPKAATANALQASDKRAFFLSGVTKNAVRLKREGDPLSNSRGQLLLVGKPVPWPADPHISVMLVSVSQQNGTLQAIIEVDGERREVTTRESERGSMGWTPPVIPGR